MSDREELWYRRTRRVSEPSDASEARRCRGGLRIEREGTPYSWRTLSL
ncbi:hypothetical protein [Porphyromonas levii]|nr:hypothetical protein [Porphyromonas levii]